MQFVLQTNKLKVDAGYIPKLGFFLPRFWEQKGMQSIFIGLQVLNISDNPTKGEDLQVNENIWSIIVPKERTYRRRPSIIRSGT
jgi:hypothetical protein